MSADDMTRDAGASRTFRSIFHQELQENELRIHMNRDENGMDDDDDDDDALWSDDAAPKARGGGGSSCSDGLEDAGEDGKGEQQHGEEDNNMMLVMDDDEEDAADDEVADAPRSEELRIPHRRSMEEWADDDDEEDTWKDMLQAKVNQLELVIQQNSNNHMDTAAALTSTNITINGEVATNADEESAHIADRPANRHKIQRTSTLHSHAAMMAGGQMHQQHPHKNASSGVTTSSATNCLRKRSGSTPSCSSASTSRPAKPQDAKKTGAATTISTRRGSKSRPSSTSSIAGLTRSSSSTMVAAYRKSSLDASTGSSIHSSNQGVRRRQSSLDDDSRTAQTASISNAESVRRYVLQDIKQMSMDRLVNDAKRLLFLEKLFQQQQATEASMMAATDTAVSPH